MWARDQTLFFCSSFVRATRIVGTVNVKVFISEGVCCQAEILNPRFMGISKLWINVCGGGLWREEAALPQNVPKDS